MLQRESQNHLHGLQKGMHLTDFQIMKPGDAGLVQHGHERVVEHAHLLLLHGVAARLAARWHALRHTLHACSRIVSLHSCSSLLLLLCLLLLGRMHLPGVHAWWRHHTCRYAAGGCCGGDHVRLVRHAVTHLSRHHAHLTGLLSAVRCGDLSHGAVLCQI